MAQIIDFPANRIRRWIFLERVPRWQQMQAVEYVRDLLREGFTPREAVAEALEASDAS